MSAIRSTLPLLAKKLIRPVDPSDEFTEFGVGACPETQFSDDDSGRAESAGHVVRNPFDVGLVDVTFMLTAVAFAGTVQLPFVPCTWIVYVSPPTSGVLRGPTTVSGRVSTMRQGVIDTNVLGLESAAIVIARPPPPIETATAAPTAAYRLRHRWFGTARRRRGESERRASASRCTDAISEPRRLT